MKVFFAVLLKSLQKQKFADVFLPFFIDVSSVGDAKLIFNYLMKRGFSSDTKTSHIIIMCSVFRLFQSNIVFLLKSMEH